MITNFVGLEHGQSTAEAALLSSIMSGDSVEKTQMAAAGTASARGFTSEMTLRVGAWTGIKWKLTHLGLFARALTHGLSTWPGLFTRWWLGSERKLTQRGPPDQDQWKLHGLSTLTLEVTQCHFYGLYWLKQSQTCLDSNGGHPSLNGAMSKNLDPGFKTTMMRYGFEVRLLNQQCRGE